MKKRKVIKIWNGRGYNSKGHLFIGAYSKADACRMLSEVYSGLTVNQWNREITIYFSPNCWGNDMQEVTPERGIWLKEESFGNETPKQIYPIGK